MTTNYEPYFKVMKQVAAERGGTYSHGTTWAAIDSTRDGERVVVEVSIYPATADESYWAADVYEYDDDNPESVDAVTGATTAELMRFVEKWV